MPDNAMRLEAWWLNLTDEQRDELLPLRTGDALPTEYVTGLTNALGVGPVAFGWVSEGGPNTFRVDSRLGDFLEAKRVERRQS